jgi:hypothetical protein
MAALKSKQAAHALIVFPVYFVLLVTAIPLNIYEVP